MENKKDIINDDFTVDSNPKINKDSIKLILPENEVLLGTDSISDSQISIASWQEGAYNRIQTLESRKKKIEQTITVLQEEIEQINADLTTFKHIYLEVSEYLGRHK